MTKLKINLKIGKTCAIYVDLTCNVILSSVSVTIHADKTTFSGKSFFAFISLNLLGFYLERYNALRL